ncbi:MAG: hypothetical protein ACR2QC_02915 [Gammaproteobacteria bacterium]
MNAAAPHSANSVLRVGGFLADTVLLAQLLALCGFSLWFFGESEWAGFAVIGGSIAGMLAIFAFTLFGVLSWFWGAAEFWRTFHPLNLALAMCAGAGYTVVVYGKFAAVSASAVFGLAAAAVAARFLPNNPRAWIAACIGILSLRYALPWRFSGIAAAAVAVFVFAVWLRNNLPNRGKK